MQSLFQYIQAELPANQDLFEIFSPFFSIFIIHILALFRPSILLMELLKENSGGFQDYFQNFFEDQD
jgi:hypothetical protein